ncbi:MAG: helix-turn-helix domain-containing protein [Bacteroidales bacterium]|jgi:transcriptional regulator with XRE-family HTH domain|nr:helix-turn-helix domain-containing protein [Bacteroidales bacterium]
MEPIGQNIRYLRKSKGLTQDELAKKIGVNRAMIGSYEENRAIPKLPVLKDLARYFNLTLDEIINQQLSEHLTTGPEETQIYRKGSGDHLRILSTVVSQENKELITTVPVQAAAGYTRGYADPEFIEELPHFSLPLNELSKERTYRVFQIKGDSMEPVKSGSYIICEYVTNWEDMREGIPYIVITKEDGIVYKRIYKTTGNPGQILLKSDNPDYHPYPVNLEEVLEIWKALGFISFELPTVENDSTLTKIQEMISELKEEIYALKNKPK